jgi:FixJ family two-component response regulator
MPNPETVYLIDDDEAVRIGLSRLLRAAGFRVQAFSSASMYLAERHPDASGCVVLDLSLPELNGFDLQAKLADDPDALPIIFLTGFGDVPSSVHAMKAGAVDFLLKPADEKTLTTAIASAFALDRERRSRHAERVDVQSRLARLSPREYEVMRLLVAGKLNKQIAAELGTAEKTVKVHRAHLLQKLGVVSVAELVMFFVETQGGAPRGSTARSKPAPLPGPGCLLAADLYI